MVALAQRDTARWRASLVWSGLLAAVCGAGILLRVWVYRSTLGIPDSDEAVVGLMARHILHGQITTFFWGQAYGGSQEALLDGARVPGLRQRLAGAADRPDRPLRRRGAARLAGRAQDDRRARPRASRRRCSGSGRRSSIYKLTHQ